MSRIGQKYISIPSGVTITNDAGLATIKGPKGQLEVVVPQGLTLTTEGDQLKVLRKNDQRQLKALHGLVRSLIQNSVVGVTTGYKKTLKLVGTGYRVQAKGKGLSLAVGLSHPVDFSPLTGVELQVEGNDTIHITGIDKQQVGQVAADIRQIRSPEPYKGKGIRYIDEQVKLKPGKTTSA